MLEEEIITPSTQQIAANLPHQRHRAVLMKRIVAIGVALSIFAIGLYALFYFQTGIWQILVDGGGPALGLVCLALAGWSVRRGKLDAAGYWILLTLAVTYGASELVWTGETLYNAISGALLILLVGSIVLRQKWRVWLVTAGLYLTYVFLVNQFEPLPRHDLISESTAIFFLDLGLTILLASAAIWMIVRAFHTGTIRTRLLIAFVIVALLPAVAIGAGASIVGAQDVRQRLIGQIELVATFKESEVNAWISGLQTDLDDVLADAGTTLISRTVLQASDIALYQDTRDELRRRFQLHTGQTKLFEEMLLLDLQGQVVVSTDAAQEGAIHSDRAYFQEGLKGPYVQPPFYSSSLGRTSVVVVRPVVDQQGQVLGVLAGRANTARLNEILGGRTVLGETGKTYLVDSNYILLAESRFGEEGAYVRTQGAEAAIADHISGSGVYEDYRSERVIGAYHWLPELQVALLAEQDETEALGGVYVMVGVIGGVAVVAVLVAVIASLFITRSIATPLADLAETATQIAAGDLERVIKVEREDEVGAAARAFGQMSQQLREMIASLEEQVAERTHQLQEANYKLQRRAIQLEASAQVGRAATSILNLDDLLAEVVNLIRDRFGFYHVGIFLLDETGEWAVLRQATGEVGQRMLARNHRLAVGGQSIVGWVTSNRQPRITPDVDADAVHFENPDLPHTHSEMALPLIVGDRLLGALDVQRTEEAAFDEEDVTILSLMADQIAVAIENALKFSREVGILEASSPLYLTSRDIALATSLDDVLRGIVDHATGPHVDRCAIGLYAGMAEDREPTYLELAALWDRASDAPGPVGTRYSTDLYQLVKYLYQKQATPLVVNDLLADMTDERLDEATRHLLVEEYQLRSVLMVPLFSAGQPLGLLIVASRQPHTWTEAELHIFRSLSDQTAVAVENTRLLKETQRHAARERLLGEISDQMQQAADIESLMRITAEGLNHALGGSRVYVRLNPEIPLRPPAGDGQTGRGDGLDAR